MEMLTLIISLSIIQLLICTSKLYQVRAGWFGIQEQAQPHPDDETIKNNKINLEVIDYGCTKRNCLGRCSVRWKFKL